jgi:hypothetical protein
MLIPTSLPLQIGATEQKEHKPKGVEGLIEIENPNLIKPKMKVQPQCK